MPDGEITMEHKLTIRNVRWYGPSIYELALDRGDVDFVPGDCVALFDAEGRESRPYSMASGTDEDVLRFVIRRMPKGKVSSYLCDCKPGMEVGASQPFGWFRPAGFPDSPSIFIATGTGISPFLAALRSEPGLRPLRILHGVRTREDAVEYEWLNDRCPVDLAVSREAAEGAHHGRVSDLYETLPVGPDHHYYLCGLDSMIDEATVFLESRDVPLQHIHRECFFNA